MATSILHRMTGVALGAGLLLLVVWLGATALGPEAYDKAQMLLGHFVGRVILFGFSLALIFHLLNGIRHLVWDTGRGLGLSGAHRASALVLAASAVLTLALWASAYALKGML